MVVPPGTGPGGKLSPPENIPLQDGLETESVSGCCMLTLTPVAVASRSVTSTVIVSDPPGLKVIASVVKRVEVASANAVGPSVTISAIPNTAVTNSRVSQPTGNPHDDLINNVSHWFILSPLPNFALSNPHCCFGDEKSYISAPNMN
jgi:hypothetical protein